MWLFFQLYPFLLRGIGLGLSICWFGLSEHHDYPNRGVHSCRSVTACSRAGILTHTCDMWEHSERNCWIGTRPVTACCASDLAMIAGMHLSRTRRKAIWLWGWRQKGKCENTHAIFTNRGLRREAASPGRKEIRTKLKRNAKFGLISKSVMNNVDG